LLHPLLGVGVVAVALVLEADLDDLLCGLGCFAAGDGFCDIPGHGFFAVEVFAGGEGVVEVLGVQE